MDLNHFEHDRWWNLDACYHIFHSFLFLFLFSSLILFFLSFSFSFRLSSQFPTFLFAWNFNGALFSHSPVICFLFVIHFLSNFLLSHLLPLCYYNNFRKIVEELLVQWLNISMGFPIQTFVHVIDSLLCITWILQQFRASAHDILVIKDEYEYHIQMNINFLNIKSLTS